MAVPRSTQPCIPLGSLNWVPASAGERAGICHLCHHAGWQLTLCDPIWQVSSRSGEVWLHYQLVSHYTTFTFFTLLTYLVTSVSCVKRLNWSRCRLQSVYLAPLRSFNELRSKVSQSTQLLPVCPRPFCDAFLRITVNLTFRTISGIFESTSGFWILLPVHRFRYVAPSFLIGNMSSRISAKRRPYGPENGKKERSWGCRGQTGSRNMAATWFFDSATPTSYSTSNTSECLSRTVTGF